MKIVAHGAPPQTLRSTLACATAGPRRSLAPIGKGRRPRREIRSRALRGGSSVQIDVPGRKCMENAARIRERLAEGDPNFRRLLSKHQEYEKRLEELQSQKYLTDAEKIEEVNIKKRKLALKDEMEEMVRQAGS